MKAVVLAAGSSSRMQPLACNRPKPMLPVVNIPIIEHILKSLRRCNIKEVLLVVGYLSDVIKGHFGDGSRLGLNISYAYQSSPEGTAKAAELSKEFVKGEPFLLVYGDILTEPQNYELLIDAYKNKRAPAAAVVSLSEVADPSAGGMVFVQDGYVERILEKPKDIQAPSMYINAGIYIFESCIFDVIAQTERSPERQEYELTTSIQKLIDNGLPVQSFYIRGYWSNLSTPEDFLEASKTLLKDLSYWLSFYGLRADEIKFIGEGTYINPKAHIQMPSIIGKNCYIGKSSIRALSSICDNVYIDDDVEVEQSVILDNSLIERASKLLNAAVGYRAKVNRGSQILGSPQEVKVVPGEEVPPPE